MRGAIFRFVLCAGLAAIWPAGGKPQSTPPAGEVFGGISYVRANADVTDFDLGGLEGSATGYVNRFLGVEADFTVYRDKLINPVPFAPGNTGPHATRASFLFGPHFAYRGKPHLNPFAHVLLGGAYGRSWDFLPSVDLVRNTHGAFAVALGGGLDVKATRFLWIRVIQVDYLRVTYPEDPQNNLRMSFGVVLRFGNQSKPGKP
jgi:hypothetical protein